jgi:hypothetical protein
MRDVVSTIAAESGAMRRNPGSSPEARGDSASCREIRRLLRISPALPNGAPDPGEPSRGSCSQCSFPRSPGSSPGSVLPPATNCGLSGRRAPRGWRDSASPGDASLSPDLRRLPGRCGRSLEMPSSSPEPACGSGEPRCRFRIGVGLRDGAPDPRECPCRFRSQSVVRGAAASSQDLRRIPGRCARSVGMSPSFPERSRRPGSRGVVSGSAPDSRECPHRFRRQPVIRGNTASLSDQRRIQGRRGRTVGNDTVLSGASVSSGEPRRCSRRLSI